MKYKMRPTNPKAEMAYVVITDGMVNWYDSLEQANLAAKFDIESAAEGDYEVSVYVLKCLTQNEPE